MVQTLLNALRIDPTVLLLNGVLFLVTLAILNFVFWKPMMRHLDGRKRAIADAYRTVEQTHGELDRLRLDYQARQARIEAQARARIQQTVREAQTQRDRMIAEARARSEEIIRQGAEAVRQEKAATAARMQQTLDDVALQAFAQATGAQPGEAQRQLVDEYIARNVVRVQS